MIIYICSPFSGDIEKNTEIAKKFSRFAVNKGYIPLTPHLLFPQFMDDRTERELVMDMDLALLAGCREIWVLSGEVTSGMRMEIDAAEDRGIPVRYFDYEEVLTDV